MLGRQRGVIGWAFINPAPDSINQILVAHVFGFQVQISSLSVSLPALSAGHSSWIMGRHVSKSELDQMSSWRAAGKTPIDIHTKLCAQRRRRNEGEPCLTAIRRALKGITHKRSRVETRGRPKVLSSRNLKSVDATRKRLIAKGGQHARDSLVRLASSLSGAKGRPDNACKEHACRRLRREVAPS